MLNLGPQERNTGEIESFEGEQDQGPDEFTASY